MRVGIYARISFDWEGKALGVARQVEDTERIATAHDWDVAGQYIDNNLSAYKRTVHRPEFERLLTDLEHGVIDGIVVYDLDRLTRQPVQLERIVAAYEARPGAVFATVQNDINLATSDGRTMARVMIAFANKSSMDTSRRQKRKNLQRAEQGMPHGSRRPYGYEDDLVTIREAEASVLREMAKRIIDGNSPKSVAYWLNEAGHRTTMGRKFYPLTVRNMLLKKRYAAIREYEGVDYPAVWEPVFDVATWEQLQASLQARAGENLRNTRYMLTGLLHCGKCGGRLNGTAKADRAGAPVRRMYVCRVNGDTQRHEGCGGVRRNAEALDHFITEMVLFRLDSPELGRLLGDGEVEQDELAKLITERDAVQARLDELLGCLADGLISRAELARTRPKLDTALGDVQNKIRAYTASKSVVLGVNETLRQAWSAHDDEWRREVVRLLVDRIVVNQSLRKPFYEANGVRYRFDTDAIDVRWKV